MSITGTPQKLVLNGISFDLMADANLKKMPDYKKEGTATTGKTLMKMTKQVPQFESVDVGATPAENAQLEDLANKVVDITMAITLADGSVYRTTGHINHDGYESESGKAALTLISSSKWTPFLA